MKFNRVPQDDYSKLIGQIDSLKSNISQMLNSNRQSTKSTARFPIKEPSKSPHISKAKGNISTIKKNSSKKGLKLNKQNLLLEQRQMTQMTQNSKMKETNNLQENRLIWRLMQVQESNQQMKKFALMLQEMLRIQIEKRRRLEKALQKSQSKCNIVQDVETKRSSFKIFTPQISAKQKERERQSRTRDEGANIQSFLLGDCDNHSYSSPPKKRTNGQLQIIELVQQVFKPASIDKRKQLKAKLLFAVNKYIRK